MIDDVLRLVCLVHITQESEFTLSILRVAVVEIDQELRRLLLLRKVVIVVGLGFVLLFRTNDSVSFLSLNDLVDDVGDVTGLPGRLVSAGVVRDRGCPPLELETVAPVDGIVPSPDGGAVGVPHTPEGAQERDFLGPASSSSSPPGPRVLGLG